jgi:hypothetical protein
METRQLTTAIDYLEANVIAWAKALAQKQGIQTMLQRQENARECAFILRMEGDVQEGALKMLKDIYEQTGFSLSVSGHRGTGTGVGKMFYFFPENPDFIKLEAILPGWRSLMIDATLVHVPVIQIPPVQVQAPLANDASGEHETLPAEFLQTTRNSGWWILNQVIRAGVLHEASIKAGGDVTSPVEAELLLSGAVNSGHTFESIRVLLEKAGIRIIHGDSLRKIVRVSLEVPLTLFKRYADDELQEAWADYSGGVSTPGENTVKAVVTEPVQSLVKASVVTTLSPQEHCRAINKLVGRYQTRMCQGSYPQSQKPHLHSRLVWVQDRVATQQACERAGYVVFSEPSTNPDKIILRFNLGPTLAFVGPNPVAMQGSTPIVPRVAHPEGGPGPQEIFARKVVREFRKHNMAVVDLNTDDAPMNARATLAGLYIRWEWMDDEALVKFIMEALNA